ncbi:MAG: nucleotidyltransferase family protein [Aminivibrio sp.]|jgi:predicted nucleotidyltransferase
MIEGLDVKEKHLSVVMQILREHAPEYEVWAFGSRVSGRARPGSDLDLVLVGSGPLPPEELGALIDAFRESSLPFFVDALDWHAIPESFRENIKRERLLLQEGNFESS